MTLHEAIIKILRQSGKQLSTREIANELNRNKWYQKKDGSAISEYQIHGRTKNYPLLFNRNGSMVSLAGQESIKQIKPSRKQLFTKNRPCTDKDESYVLDLCDKVLGITSSRQHKFDFLVGDINKNGVASKLPVDGYYSEIKLVIEYRELQHTESVSFFDKTERMTVSGVHRGEQRKIYDERRRQVLPKYNINLIEISYLDFKYDKRKRIIRNPHFDVEVVSGKLNKYIK